MNLSASIQAFGLSICNAVTASPLLKVGPLEIQVSPFCIEYRGKFSLLVTRWRYEPFSFKFDTYRNDPYECGVVFMGLRWNLWTGRYVRHEEASKSSSQGINKY